MFRWQDCDGRRGAALRLRWRGGAKRGAGMPAARRLRVNQAKRTSILACQLCSASGDRKCAAQNPGYIRTKGMEAGGGEQCGGKEPLDLSSKEVLTPLYPRGGKPEATAQGKNHKIPPFENDMKKPKGLTASYTCKLLFNLFNMLK